MSFFIFLIYMSCCFRDASGFENVTDRQALLAFKDAVTDDPNGVLRSWNSSFDHCQWRGIWCSKKHFGRVNILDLKSRGLTGHISPHIGNLSFLRVISLENNSFQGEIPPEIGKLFRLRLLYLNNNSLQGEFPTNLTSCVNLRELHLHVNNLTGKVPVGISSLVNLNTLILGANGFTGTIPRSLGNISSLVWLHLGGTNFTGSIPEELGKLRLLQLLVLHRNHLIGEIPPGIYNLSSLVSISAGGNRLEGNLPTSIGETLPNLEELYMRQNMLTGSIPISLSNCSNLQVIVLLNNSFTGRVPNELGRLKNLTWINLTANKLGGNGGNDLSFISHLANCTNLRYLLVGANLLEGSMPNSIANLSSTIEYIQLGDNDIYGNIPAGIGKLVNLNGLELQYMMLEGKIPSTISNLRNLLELRLSGNKFTGQIPSTLDNLTVLYHLDLSVNMLTGNIPSSYRKFSQLLRLDVSENNLSGEIPTSLFNLASAVSIILSHNSLTGFLPAEVGTLKLLEDFDVSNNKLSGGIPSTLGSCISLVKLHLSANHFEGRIPESLSSLRGLDELNLSSNNLSGIIPEYLGKFLFLQMLDLSFNDFEGEVPKLGVFSNASAVSLSGNSKVCGGISELKFPECTVPDSKKSGLSLSLKVIIPLVFVLLFSAFSVVLYIFCSRRNKSQQTPSVAIFDDLVIRISYQDLFQATSGFAASNLIGLGSYGSVYKGFLEQTHSLIAVKVFNLHRGGAAKSFLSECKALGKIRHRNLLKILSICSSVDHQGNDFRAIIYTLMLKGSLENWLHPAKSELNSRNLNLIQRLNIISSVASALEYLHCHCKPPIVHGDLKPSNILLDDDLVAYLGDFGLAKVMSSVSRQDGQSSSIIRGSVGYIAPEYGMGEGASVLGDIYSFGILILEMFTARRPTDEMFQDDLNLHNFTRVALPEQVMTVVDPQLVPDEDMQECLVSMLKIGLSCSMEIPESRMNIRNVVKELSLITEEVLSRKEPLKRANRSQESYENLKDQ
ncbi:Receptor kinase-like protein Xa21 [Euphorbia peplus]|nr:Receptor kinase-like protein Xa21 [Euphorbia peplus]